MKQRVTVAIRDMREMHCTVSGRVQFVMFRDFVRRTATRLGITGFVQNSADGTVFLVAQGAPEALEELERVLHEGSFLSRVDEVQTTWHAPTERFPDFSIVR